MIKSNAIKSSLIGAALAAAPVSAQTASVAAADNTISIAVVDTGTGKIAFPDANVEIVNLTPPPPKGFKSGTIGQREGVDHGTMVASAFVDEYRKIDPTAHIRIYALNPFLQHIDQVTYHREIVQNAMAELKATNVKVVVTAFGVADKASGDVIMADFNKAGMIVFAALPNAVDDPGIYPAANKSSIAIAAGGDPRLPVYRDAPWRDSVDFVADGRIYSKRSSVGEEGSSFASGRAAAYGAYMARANPNITVSMMKDGLRSLSQPSLSTRFAEIGGKDSISKITSMSLAGSQGMLSQAASAYQNGVPRAEPKGVAQEPVGTKIAQNGR